MTPMVIATIVILLILLSHQLHQTKGSMPLPFTRELKLTTPIMEGKDVLIATTLMSRCACWPSYIQPSLQYTQQIASAIKEFQTHLSLKSDGKFGTNTATTTLRHYSYDGYVDRNILASDYGALYKIFIPVYNDSARDIETMAQLFDANNELLLTFKTRTHGQSDPQTDIWPNYNNSVGLNQFTTNGNTPTGLSYIDLNSPEPHDIAKYYGTYPIHRVIAGISYENSTSNMELLLQPQSTDIRNDIMLHTGEWPQWIEGEQMPNSEGCIHIYPDALQTMNDILTNKLGVVVNNNPLSGNNYPYKAQGILSVQQIK